MVGDRRPAYGSEVDCVVGFEGVEAVRRHVVAAFQVGGAAPVVVGVGECEGAVAGGEGVEDLFGGGGDVNADAVAGDGGDFVEGW